MHAGAGMSNLVLVNSHFTADTYRATFPALAHTLPPQVLYPAINFDKYDKKIDTSAEK